MEEREQCKYYLKLLLISFSASHPKESYIVLQEHDHDRIFFFKIKLFLNGLDIQTSYYYDEDFFPLEMTTVSAPI